MPRWRAVLLRVLLAPAALMTLAFSGGIVTIWEAGPGQNYIYAASTPWKLLSMGGALLAFWTAARSVVAVQWWVIGVGVWAVLTALSDQHGATYALVAVMLALVVVPVAALRPRRAELLELDPHPSPLLLTLALTGAVPLVLFAIGLADDATRFDSDGTTAELYFDAAGVALSTAMVGVFAALRPSNTHWLLFGVAVVPVWAGLFGLVWPDDLGSPGTLGGLAMIAGGVLFGLASRWEYGRRAPGPAAGAGGYHGDTASYPRKG